MLTHHFLQLLSPAVVVFDNFNVHPLPKSPQSPGLLAIAEGKSSSTLKEYDISRTNVSTQNDGGRLFIAALCIRCVSLKVLSMHNTQGLCVGAFEAVLTSSGNVLEDKVATAKLPSIQVLNVSDLSTKRGTDNDGDGSDNQRNSSVVQGLSDIDLSGVLLCIHKNARQLNMNRCFTLTDDALRSICHKKTSWGYTAHLGSIRMHTLSLCDCALLSDVSMGWISTGCPNVEVLNISGCTLLTDWG